MARIVYISFLIIAQLTYGQKRSFELPSNLTTADYDPQTIIVKLESVTPTITRSHQNRKSISQLASILGAGDYRQAFAKAVNSPANVASRRSMQHPLDNIYKVQLLPGTDIEQAINQLLQFDNVLYAEPQYSHRPLFIPNDPLGTPNGPQVHLSIVKAFEAWDLEKGDSEMIIAILDTGTDFNHQDLQDNLYINEADPPNGIDDDEDGYVDNYRGWDFANNDSDPSADFDDHGVRVAGMSSASTDNGIGIAGSGYNTKYMPLKIFTSEGNNFFMGFEAIVYAADKGCKVINLSWGDASPYSQFEQDIINYAVLERDAVVIAAAGNSNADQAFYPASYDNVLSVAATNNGDQKASFSTYNENVDISAPGNLVYTLFQNNGYNNTSGTSFSSPLVAGAAALVRARFPELNAIQVMEKLKVTSDDIGEVSGNQPYVGKLGKGRLNMFRALNDNTLPSLKQAAVTVENDFGNFAFHDDTIEISVDIMNYLQPTQNAKVTLTKVDDDNANKIFLVDSVFELGKVATLEVADNQQEPFVVYLNEEIPRGSEITLQLNYEDGQYTDSELIRITTSPDYVTANNGKLSLSLHGNSSIGTDSKPGTSEFVYDGSVLANHIGFYIAQEVDQVASSAAANLVTFNRDTDFISTVPVKLFGNSIADFDARSQFAESGLTIDPINVHVEQKLLAWESNPGNQQLILEYRLTNRSGATIDDLHIALFANWNIDDAIRNRAGWEDPDKLGYVYNNAQSTYAGVALLTGQAPIYNALDIASENGNSQDLGPIFSKTDKYNLASNGIDQTTAGELGDGNDVAHIVGGSILSFGDNESIKIAFALTAGGSLTDLKSNINVAAGKYQEYLDSPPIITTAYTCEGEDAKINPSSGTIFEFYQDPALNTLLHTGEEYTVSNVTSPQSLFVVNKDHPFDSDVAQVIAAVKPISATFEFDHEPFLIDELDTSRVHFINNSINDVEWVWDFGNGFGSTLEEPSIRYNEKGTYTIELVTKNDIGCEATISKNLDVQYRSFKPDIGNIQTCRETLIEIDPQNVTQMQLYTSPDLGTPALTGASLNLGPFSADTVFYITSIDSTFESNPTELKITVSEIMSEFNFEIDTVDLQKRYLLNLSSASTDASTWQWIANGNEIATIANTHFDYSGLNDLNISLTVTDELGCSDMLSRDISLKKSPTPAIHPVAICPGDDVTLRPSGGTIFYFYEDVNKTNLIYKGRELILTDVVETRTLYISNIDSLLESELASATIDVSAVTADFTQSLDTLNLSEGNSVQFNYTGNAATAWQWIFGNGQVSTASDPLVEFSQLGKFGIELMVTDDIGCMSKSNSELVVVSITDIQKTGEHITIYPNPSSGIVNLITEGIQSPNEVQIRDVSGKLLLRLPFSKGEKNLDLSELPAGVYAITIIGNSNHYTHQLILQR